MLLFCFVFVLFFETLLRCLCRDSIRCRWCRCLFVVVGAVAAFLDTRKHKSREHKEAIHSLEDKVRRLESQLQDAQSVVDREEVSYRLQSKVLFPVLWTHQLRFVGLLNISACHSQSHTLSHIDTRHVHFSRSPPVGSVPLPSPRVLVALTP